MCYKHKTQTTPFLWHRLLLHLFSPRRAQLVLPKLGLKAVKAVEVVTDGHCYHTQVPAWQSQLHMETKETQGKGSNFKESSNQNDAFEESHCKIACDKNAPWQPW